MALRVERLQSVDDFLERSGDFLAAREAEHNLLLGICTSIRSVPELYAADPPRFLVVTDRRGRVVAASLRTPPHRQVLSEVDDPAAVDALVDALHVEPVPGLLGPPEHAARFAERWTAATRRGARLVRTERIFRLDRVVPPARPASGSWRTAEAGDRDTIAGWLIDFVVEALAGDEPPRPEDAAAAAERWIAGRHRRLYLWEDAGTVVSMVGAGGETPNGVRIGPVYTPPDRRGHGYATTLTAAASQDQLERGRRFCFLFTDLANPTSNRIYREIGYRAVRDLHEYHFETDG